MRVPSTVRSSIWVPLVAIVVLLLAGCGASAPTTSTPSAGPAVDLPALVRQVEASVVTVLTGSGVGSGIVYKTDGTVVTNAHVVEGARQVSVAFADGQQVSANVRAVDRVTDVAVLQADRTDLTAATFETALPEVGALAVVVGSPLGGFEATVTSGIISGLHRQIPGSASPRAPLVDLIQTDAAISPGNSGGCPDRRTRAGRGDEPGLHSPVGGCGGSGFAIPPAANVVDVADQLLASGTAQHPYVGIQPGTLSPQIAEQLAVDRTSGAVVLEVVPLGPAATAGIRPGDVITAVNGHDIESAEDFIAALRALDPGDRVDLTVLRGGETQQISVTVTDRPAS